MFRKRFFFSCSLKHKVRENANLLNCKKKNCLSSCQYKDPHRSEFFLW